MNNKNKLICIYKIRNIKNNKIYIGSTNNWERRLSEHLTALKHNNHINYHLQNAYNKYGKDNFVFEIQEKLDSLEQLQEREQYWIDYFNSANDEYGYNIQEIAKGRRIGCLSQETKDKISRSRKGTPAWNKGLKCPQWSGELHGMYGKHHSKQTKEKLSKSHKGLKASDITKKKMSEAQKRIGNKPPTYKGAEHPGARSVICLKDKKVFGCIKDCSEYYNISILTIRNHCNNKLKDFNKINFQFWEKGVDY